MARKPTGRPNGRPKIQIDNEQFKKLCELQCTKEEIAGFFNCGESKIEEYCKEEYGDTFQAVFKRLSVGGKMSLRRYQFELAKHNASMAIFLGKQMLGQRDDIASLERKENANEKSALNAVVDVLKDIRDKK
jgi:glutathione peroxidase-family protein